ncbi:DUF3040 domain-containing protein [Streptomyces sp. SCUT-3]|uniref:DUF3040 domain-containing protein n=1 Tax=Streptomyces TaxID=1883 RepID=UPI000CAC94C1|nr:DUF3040 domain-containing protein [Streptomyces sp. SCUT-3]PLW71642.1 hypothetical protein C0036_16780 [Streptomyces sp. DJ]QMV20692.1 DUF3040 domain-containing protein [Streptomyces sp. SCUT-3]
MGRSDEESLAGLEDLVRREDPRFTRALADGRPCSPREYRRGPAWSVLALAVAVLLPGLVVGQGLLVALGLVLAGAAGHLFDPHRDHPRCRASRSRR